MVCLIPRASSESPLLAISGIQAGRETPRKLNKTSQAAVAWLTSQDLDAFDHLVAICFRAKRNLFIAERGKTLVDSTRNWIETFLLEFLFPYQHATPAEIAEAAERGAFQHIARLCRLRMLDEVRKRTALKRKEPPTLSLNQPLATDEDGQPLTLSDVVEDCGGSPLGHRAPLEENEVALTLWQNREDLARLLGQKLLVTLKAVLCAHLNGEEPTKAVARRRQVCERQARRDTAALREILQSALKDGNAAARNLYELLAEKGSPVVREGRLAKKPGLD